MRHSLQHWNNIFPGPGFEPGPLDSKSYTLPRRYKSRLVPQGSTSVLYTYTRWQMNDVTVSFYMHVKIIYGYSPMTWRFRTVCAVPQSDQNLSRAHSRKPKKKMQKFFMRIKKALVRLCGCVYSRTSIARTPMARLPWLIQTRFWGPTKFFR